jgi:nitrate/nitrite transport system substrate-binding protein
MRRWGQIAEYKDDAWYADMAKKVYKPDIYMKAADMLIAEGKAKAADFPAGSDGYRGPQDGFIDGLVYDGKKPNAYIDGFKIGLKGKDQV